MQLVGIFHLLPVKPDGNVTNYNHRPLPERHHFYKSEYIIIPDARATDGGLAHNP